MVERGNFGRKSSSLKLNGSPLGKLTFQWFERLPRAHSVGVIIVKIMNQLLDVRQLLVEVLEVGPCLLVFLIFLIFLILFHNTSFDNLKAEKLRPHCTETRPRDPPHLGFLTAPGSLLQLVLEVCKSPAHLVQHVV